MALLVSEDFQRNLATVLRTRRDIPKEQVDDMSTWIRDSVAMYRLSKNMYGDEVSTGRGRPADLDLSILEHRVLRGFFEAGTKPTKAEEGTYAIILEYVYAEIGLPNRNAFKTVRRLLKDSEE